MPLRGLEKLKSALVVIPPEGEHRLQFDTNEVARYLREPEIAGGPGVPPRITSVRDQMVVVIAGKIMFEDQSDLVPATTSKLPEVASGFIGMFRRQGIEKYKAYGWNFDVVFDAPGEEPAASMLASNFLDTKAFSKRAQIDPVGAGISVFFMQGSARCRLRLDPRQQDLNTPLLFASINYHYELDPPAEVPNLDDLRLSYYGLWGSFNDLLMKLVKP